MRPTCLPIIVLLAIYATAIAQSRSDHSRLQFDGRAVTIREPETDQDGFFAKGPASVCLEAPPQRQCYTAPKDFGRHPTVTTVELKKDLTALFFSAASGGVSGFTIQFALLRPGTGEDLENLFLQDVSVSNQSENAFWTDPSISDVPFFVTGDYVWGPDESHYSPHRYIVSVYVWTRSFDLENDYYYLQDRYMTSRTYEREPDAEIVLTAEKPEIVAHLRRVKLMQATRPVPK